MFIKLMTKHRKPIEISTSFKKITKDKKIVGVDDVQNFIRKPCMVMAALKIDNIFISASIMSIQVKMREVLIVKEIEKMSVFSDDDVLSDDEKFHSSL